MCESKSVCLSVMLIAILATLASLSVSHAISNISNISKSVCLSVMLLAILATLATSVGICYGVPSTAHSRFFFVGGWGLIL